jgi:hypothetical protein
VAPYSVAAGETNKIHSGYSVAFGSGNTLDGDAVYSIAVGSSNESIHYCSAVFGSCNKTSADQQFIIGRHNKENPNAIFQVGWGNGYNDKKNAFEVLSDGIIVNDVTLTSEKLAKIIKFIDSIEEVTE